MRFPSLVRLIFTHKSEKPERRRERAAQEKEGREP